MTLPQHLIHTDAGDFPLHEYRLGLAGRQWRILHTGAMLTYEDETRFFREQAHQLPYGVALWPASIALAHDIAARAEEFRGRNVLELGAGTGLPGIVAASFGARVTQTDRSELPLSLCRRNGELNGAPPITYRQADWASWTDGERYDWIVGSDILYGESLHQYLRQIFEANLALGGRILLSDPFRALSLGLLEQLEASGWAIALAAWSVGEDEAPRRIGVYELARPA
jgi:predicted nicotinamide N-methyase